MGTFIISGKNVEHGGKLESSSTEVPEICVAEDEWLDYEVPFACVHSPKRTTVSIKQQLSGD